MWKLYIIQFTLYMKMKYGLLGQYVATNPWRTCSLMLLMVMMCATGFTNMKVMSLYIDECVTRECTL